MSKEKVVVIRETNFESYIADTFTFASICASFWFNYKFVGGNDALDVLLFISFFTFSLGRMKNTLREINKLIAEDKAKHE